MNKIAVNLMGISKEYLVTHQKPTLIGNVLGRHSTEKFWALKDINLSIKRGEKVGIIGPNGAGKTTLLKVIAQITSPTVGTVQTYGKVVSLMNLEAGFHPELTGEENIYINGMLIGMTKVEVKNKIADIIKFADIGRFIDAPFYTYSDGMKFRVAFAVASASKCDILVIDEIFVVGDSNFQEKTFKVIRETQSNENVTTILTSHLAALISAFSDTFYELDKGKIIKMTKKEMLKAVAIQDDKWRKRTRLS